MFYSQFILAKKGPLGTIWIAAHLERKLRKNQVADTDIGFSVDSILFPEVPIALRLSSHLLLGVVRIYSKKVTYLFDDCSEALLQIKQAFRSTAVDLPPEESTAPYHSITLPETFDLDDFELPDNDLFQGNYVDHHISSKEQITLQDTMEGVVYSTSQFGLDERFGDGDTSGLDLDEELLMDKVASEGQTDVLLRSESNADPQASVRPMTPLKKDDDLDTVAANLEILTATTSSNQIDDLDGDADHVEYAQAPCTPGLWEEPNLSTVQETSAFDDHLESENHNLTEFAVMKNLENATSNSELYNGDKSVEAVDLDPSHSVSVVENGYHSDNPEPIAEMPEKSAVVDQVENGQNVDVTTTEPCDLEAARNIDNSHELESTVESYNTACLDAQETPLCQEPQLSNNFNIPSLRPCTTHVNLPDVSTPVAEKSLDPETPFEGTVLCPLENSGGEEPPYSSGAPMLVQGEGSLEIVSNRSLEETDIHTPSIKTVDGADNIVSGNSLNNILSPTTSDMPAPEKLLSVSEELANVSINLLPETTPNIEVFEGGNVGDTLAGKKRSFAESASTVQSITAAESYGVFGTKMTAELVPNDDDLLSSILVGRKSSMLKVKSTPPLAMTSKKRRRSAARTGASKRKVLLDDTMVLHGDTIRQQLTNTEDIRRIRKKAPCTRPEISMIQKQFWEDELFTEPIFTGVSMELASLHNQAYDLTEIRIVQTDASLESAISIPLVSQSDQNSVPLEASNYMDIEVKENSEAQPVETLVLTANQLSENNTMGSEFCGSEAEIHPSTCVEEPRSSEHEILGETTPMEIDGKTHSDTDVGIQPVSSEKADEADISLQINAPGIDDISVIVEGKDDVAADKDELVLERNEDVASVEMSRHNEGDCLEDTQTEIPTAPFSSETGGGSTQIPTVDQAMEEVREEEQKLATGSPFADAEEYNAKNFVTDMIYGDELVIDPSFSAEVNVHAENVLFDGENPNQQEGYPDVTPNADISAIELEDRYDSDYTAVGHDTEFLNVDDDDDEAEADGDYVPNAEEAGFIDNSGWSTRTRAVAKYLQTLFDKESERGRKVLPVDNLLAGKTRKEASRMFFETLVLKTKDFIHVDQQNPYDNINLLPKVKLMKSDF